MLFNPSKCKVMHIGQEKLAKFPNSTRQTIENSGPKKKKAKRTPKEYMIYDSHSNTTIPLSKTDQERDLGITMTSDMKWHTQIKLAVNKANKAMGLLKRTFKNWDIRSFKTLYCSTVRPHLEYASTAWSPYLKQDIKALERVQRQATKIVRTIRHLSYDQRLKAIGITRLSARIDRGDAIQYFKSKIDYNHIAWYHVNPATNSLKSSGPAGGIRGNSHRIIRQLIKNCPARNNLFTNRVVNNWNSLPEKVIAARTVNSFKNLYDNHLIKSNTLL
jgi:ribonuclease P/MRP protein subunit RPP40